MSYSERGGYVRMCRLPKKLRVEGIISCRWMACLLGLIGYLFICVLYRSHAAVQIKEEEVSFQP